MKIKYLNGQRGAIDMVVIAVLFVLAIGVGVYLKFFSHAGGSSGYGPVFTTVQAEALKYGVNGSGQYPASTAGVSKVRDARATNGGAVKITDNGTTVGVATKATLANANFYTHYIAQTKVNLRTKTCSGAGPITLTYKLYSSKHPDSGIVNSDYRAYATGNYFDQVYEGGGFLSKKDDPLILELIAGVPKPADSSCTPALYIDKISFTGASVCAPAVGLVESAYAGGYVPPAPGADCSAGAPTTPHLKSASFGQGAVIVKWDRPADYHKVKLYRFYKNGREAVGTFDVEGYNQTSTGLTGNFAPGDIIQMKAESFAGAVSKASNGVRVK
ncbi:MAG TPA: hypothetical protein VLF21_03685 [Candidatus Saccharimonadales bacterium]|nr:hypothetical protein [Candidatus Saccharimonadales bacterium]